MPLIQERKTVPAVRIQAPRPLHDAKVKGRGKEAKLRWRQSYPGSQAPRMRRLRGPLSCAREATKEATLARARYEYSKAETASDVAMYRLFSCNGLTSFKTDYSSPTDCFTIHNARQKSRSYVVRAHRLHTQFTGLIFDRSGDRKMKPRLRSVAARRPCSQPGLSSLFPRRASAHAYT